MNAPARRVTRAAPAARSAPAARQPASGGGKAYYTGDEGVNRIDEEIEAAKARRANSNGPWRFFVDVGGTRDFVIVDDKPTFFRYEHEFKIPGQKQRLHVGCVKMHDNCPGCAKDEKESYYGMYLTVIDLTPYTNKNNEEVPFMKKLMLVKSQQQKKVLRFMERQEQGGLLRGCMIRASRDGEKEPRIGNDWEYLGCMPDEELATYNNEWTDRENKQHVDYGNEPYDYVTLFGNIDAETIRALVGGEPAAGSRAANARALNQPRRAQRDGWEGAGTEGQGPYDGQGEETAAPAARRAAPRQAPASRQPAAATTARPGATRAAPAQRTAARPAARPAPVQEEEVPDEVVEEGQETVEEAAPPVRVQVRRPQPGQRPPAGRRMAPSEQDEGADEVVEDPAPQPRRVSFRR